MLSKYFVNLIFPLREIQIFKAHTVGMTHEELRMSLGLESLNDASVHLLVDHQQEGHQHSGPEILAVLDNHFLENGEFGIPKNEKGLIELAKCFAEELYILSSSNYDEVAESVYEISS